MTRSTTASPRTWVVTLLAAVLTGAGALPAGAHMKVTEREWAFSSYTRGNEDMAKKIDPITVVWAGKPVQYTPSRIEQALDNQWPLGNWETGADCQGVLVPSGTQGLWYQNAVGRNGTFDDDQDLNLVNAERKCGSQQYHTRLWNDFEHVDLFPGVHNANDIYSWMVGGIHREVWKGIEDDPRPNGHRLIEGFERTARTLGGWLALCFPDTQRKWRYLPGSTTRSNHHYNYSDGYLTKIDLSKKQCQ